MTCLRKLLAQILLFNYGRYIQCLYTKLYAKSGKRKHQSIRSQALGCVTWMERNEYMNICNLMSHNSGPESDYSYAAISQEKSLWNKWNFSKSIQKQNKLVSSSAHTRMWSDTLKKVQAAVYYVLWPSSENATWKERRQMKENKLLYYNKEEAEWWLNCGLAFAFASNMSVVFAFARNISVVNGYSTKRLVRKK